MSTLLQVSRDVQGGGGGRVVYTQPPKKLDIFACISLQITD